MRCHDHLPPLDSLESHSPYTVQAITIIIGVNTPRRDGSQEVEDALRQELESAAEQIVAEFQQGMQEVMDNLEKAQMAFDDLSGELSLTNLETTTVVPWLSSVQCCHCCTT
jgi:hypothetical protein